MTFNSENRTPEYEAAVKALIKLDLDLALAAYAETTKNRAMKQFAAGRKTPRRNAKSLKAIYQAMSEMPHGLQAADHEQFWIRSDGQLEATFEPYDLWLRDLKELVAFCEKTGMDIRVTGQGMWFPGRTVMCHLYPSQK